MTYKISEFDGLTGETVLRDMTAEESAQYEADNEKRARAAAEVEAQKEAKATAKAAIAERLGLTDAELALLLG
jgi:uncharacterized metal-binding protein